MPFCHNCGALLDETAKFCTSCGTPILGNEPSSQKDIQSTPGIKPDPVPQAFLGTPSKAVQQNFEMKDTQNESSILQNAPNNGNIFKVGAALSIVSILFLPVVGCGDENVNGVDIIGSNNVTDDVKLFLIASVICGVIIFFLKEYIHVAVTAILGIVTLLISYLIARDKMGALELKAGAILTFISYGTVAILSFLKSSEKKRIELSSTNTKPTNSDNKIEKTN